MADSKVRIGVIGVGGMGQGHLDKLKLIAECEVVGVTDVSAALVKEVSEKYKVPGFGSPAELVNKARPAGCTVASPHPAHLANALECFARGVHVFTEKPMTAKVSEADQMIAAAKKAKLILAVMFQFRTFVATRRAKELLDSGAIGEVRRVSMFHVGLRTNTYYKIRPWRGTWQHEGGGVLVNQSPHTLDRAVFLAGLPAKVLARTMTYGHPIETEDQAEALLSYPNGATGYMFMSTAEAPALNRMEISGDRGRLVIDDDHNKLLLGKLPDSCREFLVKSDGEWASLKAEWQELDINPRPGEEQGHIGCLRDFCQAIRDRRPPMVTGEDGRRSLELANAITLSSFNGAEVELPLDRRAYDRLYAFACANGRGKNLGKLIPLWRKAAAKPQPKAKAKPKARARAKPKSKKRR
jgi:predicted dehydrogenase